MQLEGYKVLEHDPSNANVWFQKLELFISLVRRSCHAKTEGMKAIYELLEIDIPRTRRSPFGHYTFPELSQSDRYQLLRAASYFQTMQPHDLTDKLLAAGLTQAQMLPTGICCPDALLPIKHSLPKEPSSPKKSRKANNHWPEPRPIEAVQRLLDDLYREKRRRER